MAGPEASPGKPRDADDNELATVVAEAERGYDVEELQRRRRSGRPTMGSVRQLWSR
jgi:hypothetical protein